MKRLIDDPDVSSSALAELVRHAQTSHSDPLRKKLVLSRLRAARARSFRLRLGPALAVALVGTATASAAVGYEWIRFGSPAEKSDDVSPPVVPPPAPARPITPRHLDKAAPQSGQPAPAAQAETSSPGQPAAEATRGLGPAKTGRSTPKTSAALTDKAVPPGEDPAPVLDAIRALRKSSDPERAQKLLDQYLASNPRGALSEDALGLAMEAAAARRDPRAAEYARRYLARFPNGRFRALAHKALAGR